MRAAPAPAPADGVPASAARVLPVLEEEDPAGLGRVAALRRGTIPTVRPLPPEVRLAPGPGDPIGGGLDEALVERARVRVAMPARSMANEIPPRTSHAEGGVVFAAFGATVVVVTLLGRSGG